MAPTLTTDDEEMLMGSAFDGKVVHSNICRYLAEFIGTYFLVLTVGCCVLTGSIGAALSIGSVLMVMIYALGSVSGAHFNPAVTVAILLSARRLLEITDAFAYIAAQLLGGLCAGMSYR